MGLNEKMWLSATVFAALWLLLVRTARTDPALYWQIEYVFGSLVAIYGAGALVMGFALGRSSPPDLIAIVEFMQVSGLFLIALLMAAPWFRRVARMPPLDPSADRSALERDRPRIRRPRRSPSP